MAQAQAARLRRRPGLTVASWHIAVLSKDSWLHPRRARKQLLYQAMAGRSEVASILYANGSRLWWRPRLADVAMQVPARMQVFTPLLPLPGERLEPVRRLNRRAVTAQLRRRWRASGGERALFFYNPRDVEAALAFRGEARVIFDWTEDWADFYHDRSLVRLQERAVREADAVLTVTEALAERAKWLRGDERVLWLPNATALPIAPDVEAHPALQAIPSPRMGYLGHLGPWFDAPFVRQLALACPDYSFVFVGGSTPAAERELAGIGNVHCLGTHHLDELPAFLAGFDLCIAPYIGQGFSGDASKFYDYLTCGKPIVTTSIPGIGRFGDLLYVADGVEGWREALDGAMREPPDRRERRLLEASRHNWEHRAEELMAWLAGLEV